MRWLIRFIFIVILNAVAFHDQRAGRLCLELFEGSSAAVRGDIILLRRDLPIGTGRSPSERGRVEPLQWQFWGRPISTRHLGSGFRCQFRQSEPLVGGRQILPRCWLRTNRQRMSEHVASRLPAAVVRQKHAQFIGSAKIAGIGGDGRLIKGHGLAGIPQRGRILLAGSQRGNAAQPVQREGTGRLPAGRGFELLSSIR